MNDSSPFSPRLVFDRQSEEAEPVRLAVGTAAVYSNRAPGKTTANEDAAAVIPCGPLGCVLAVADGLGGAAGGELAARTAIEALAAALAALPPEHLLRTAILDGFERANQAVRQIGGGAATTLAAVEVQKDCVRPYHVGDSMILVVGSRGKIKLQTICHSPVGYAVESGWLDAADAIHHEDRHLVSNFLGSDQMRIEIGPQRKLDPLDTVLLASDGLFDNLHVEEVVAAIRKGRLDRAAYLTAQQCRRRMLDPTPGEPSKPDDLTLIVFRPPRPPRRPPQKRRPPASATA